MTSPTVLSHSVLSHSVLSHSVLSHSVLSHSVLVDTHILLWVLQSTSKLSNSQKHYLQNSTTKLVSSISICELSIKASIGKMTMPADLLTIIKAQGFEYLDFQAADAILLAELPLYHKDPFDRMLIAQSQRHKIPLISSDSMFSRYECHTIY